MGKYDKNLLTLHLMLLLKNNNNCFDKLTKSYVKNNDNLSQFSY